MSYHISILRTNGQQRVPITTDEILGLVATHPGWKYDAKKNALVFLDETNKAKTLWFSDGELWTQNPNDETISAMLAIAGHLGARMRGDEFETYRTATETYFHPDDFEARSRSKMDTQALLWRTRLTSWLFHIAIFGGFLVLIWLFRVLGFLK